jgi:hypothetical protein
MSWLARKKISTHLLVHAVIHVVSDWSDGQCICINVMEGLSKKDRQFFIERCHDLTTLITIEQKSNMGEPQPMRTLIRIEVQHGKLDN